MWGSTCVVVCGGVLWYETNVAACCVHFFVLLQAGQFAHDQVRPPTRITVRQAATSGQVVTFRKPAMHSRSRSGGSSQGGGASSSTKAAPDAKPKAGTGKGGETERRGNVRVTRLVVPRHVRWLSLQWGFNGSRRTRLSVSVGGWVWGVCVGAACLFVCLSFLFLFFFMICLWRSVSVAACLPVCLFVCFLCVP